MKKLILIFTLFLSVHLSLSQNNTHVFFEENSAKLSSKSQKTLDSLSNQYALNEIEKIVLIGHTNTTGSKSYNKQLSYSRVESVASYLKKKYDPTLFNIGYQGEEQPLFPTNTEQGRKYNRRVSILFHKKTSLPIILEKFPLEKLEKNISLEEVLEKFQPKIQFFTINANQKNVLTTKGNCQLVLLDNSFGMDLGEIEIQVTEYLSYSDMLLANLQTKSSHKLLETGGMVKVEAFKDGKKVELYKPMLLSLPTNEVKEGMQTFYGKEHINPKTSQKVVNWHLSNENRVGGARGVIMGKRSWWVRLYEFFAGSEEQKIEKQLAKEEKLVEESLASSGNGLTKRELNKAKSHILQVEKMGWINCDRFYEATEKADLYVKDVPDKNTRILIFFQDIKSVMAPSQLWNKTSSFRFLPKDQEVILVGIKNKQDKLFLSFEKTTISNNTIKMNFEEVTAELLTEKLKMLD